MPVVIGTGTPQDCDCCKCNHVIQLRDCCDDSLVPIAVCDGVGYYTHLKYNDACYVTNNDTVTLEYAVAQGWTILKNSDFNLITDCYADDCLFFYQTWYPVCGLADTGAPCNVPGAEVLLTGPCYTRPDDYGWAQIGGRWYELTGMPTYRLNCDPLIEADETHIFLSSSCIETVSEPELCCLRCVTGGSYPDEICSFYQIPCCVQVSGMSFGGTCTPATAGDPWDGICSCTPQYFGGYAPASSALDPPFDGCVSNIFTGNGKVPGTNVDATCSIWFSCDDMSWYLDLGGIWSGSGGSDPSDPTGTYTVIGTPGCSGPSTLTVSAI